MRDSILFTVDVPKQQKTCVEEHTKAWNSREGSAIMNARVLSKALCCPLVTSAIPDSFPVLVISRDSRRSQSGECVQTTFLRKTNPKLSGARWWSTMLTKRVEDNEFLFAIFLCRHVYVDNCFVVIPWTLPDTVWIGLGQCLVIKDTVDWETHIPCQEGGASCLPFHWRTPEYISGQWC